MSLLYIIIMGAILGGLARLLMKGDQPMGIVATIVLGILGAIVGYFVADLFGVAQTNGIDWIRWIISLVLSVLFIGAYLAFKGRPKSV